MNVIITGSNGYLGQHLTQKFLETGYDVYAFSRGDNQFLTTNSRFHYLSIDLTNKEAVIAAVKAIQPDAIVHNAAMSKPDLCQQNPDACVLQNVGTTQYLLEAAQDIKPYFLYVSSDFIYGENGPHDETTLPAPLNFYGNTKLMGEQAVMASGLTHGIMRPVFIYGPSEGTMKPTFLHWVKNSLVAGKHIKVVNDQFRTPTYVGDICFGVHAMVEKKYQGAINLAGKDLLTPYAMACAVAAILELDASLIESVTSDTFPEPVVRAKKSGLLTAKAERELNYHPVSFEEGVRRTFQTTI